MKTFILKLLFFIVLFNFSPKSFGNWKEINSPQINISINEIYKIKNSLIAFNKNKIFRSIDDGESWETINYNGLDSIYQFDIIKKNNDKIYIGLNQFRNKVNGIFASDDLGINFEQIYLNDILDFEFKNNKMHIFNNRSLTIYDEEMNLLDSIFVGFAPYSFNKIYLTENDIVIYDKGALSNSKPFINDGIIYSLDNGNNWLEWNDGLGRDFGIYNCVYFSDSIAFIGTNKGFFKSDGYGKKWETYILPTKSQEITNLFKEENNIYISSSIGEIYYSSDNGLTWDSIYFDVNNYRINTIKKIDKNIYFTSVKGLYKIVDNIISHLDIKEKSNYLQLEFVNNNAYLGVLYNGILYSENKQENWVALNDSIFENSTENNRFKIKDSLILAYDYSKSHLSISRDLGKTWKDTLLIDEKDRIIEVNIFEKVITINSKNFLLYSYDGGHNWSKINKLDPVINLKISKIYQYNDSTFLASSINSGIYISNDYCKTWKRITESEQSIIYNQTTYYIVFNQNKIFTPKLDSENYANELLISTDKGKNWLQKEFNEYKVYIMNLINYKENIFLFTSDGLFYSKDFGETWVNYKEGLDNFIKDQLNFIIYRDLDIYNGDLYLTLKEKILKLPLLELGIEYTSVTERIPSNYLFSYPPYPHPSNNQINVKVEFDNQLIFNKDNIEIYSIFGSKVNIDGNVNLIREDDYHALVTWDVSNINPGIYIMQVTYGNEKLIWKIIIS